MDRIFISRLYWVQEISRNDTGSVSEALPSGLGSRPHDAIELS